MTGPSRSAIFFDRDGVLNVDHGYVFQAEQLEWMPGAKDSIKRLNDLGVLVIVVTNQSGVARGLYTMEDVDRLMESMQDDLSTMEARLDRWYVCPHHPIEGATLLTRDCDCRKPKPGLILQGLRDFELDPSQCALIGDKKRDVQAGESAGVQSYLFEGGDLAAMVDVALRNMPSPTPEVPQS